MLQTAKLLIFKVFFDPIVELDLILVDRLTIYFSYFSNSNLTHFNYVTELTDYCVAIQVTVEERKSFSTSQIRKRIKALPKITQQNINMQKKLQIKYSEDFIQ